MAKVKVAGYGRMSTIDQKESPKVQEEAIRRWFNYQIESDKWPQGAEFIGMFIDEAISSKVYLLDRKFGEFILTVLDRGDVFVVSKIDRAFRSTADMERTLDTFKEAGIHSVFLDFPLADNTTAMGEFMLGQSVGIARFERKRIGERTREALRSKQKRGEAVGSAVAGFKREKGKGSKKLIPDIEQRKLGFAAAELIRKGHSRTMVGKLIRPFVEKHGIKCGVGDRTLVNTAAASCLDFPICGNRKSSEILGINTLTFEFVRRKDHDDLKDKLYRELRNQGWDC